MKYYTKKNYLIICFIISIFFGSTLSSKSSNNKYLKDDISNYFSGVVSSKQNYTISAFKYLNKVQSIKDIHRNYKIEFIRTLVLLEKYDDAIKFSKSIWLEEDFLFEADLLLGLNSLIEEDYQVAKKHFLRIKDNLSPNLLFEEFLGNILLAWNEAAQKNTVESLVFFNKIPNRYLNLKNIQNCFFQCYFDTKDTKLHFENLVEMEGAGYSRYYFFFANYLISKNNIEEAKKIIISSRKENTSNILLKQSENFILNNKTKEITNFFDCTSPKDNLAEIFYLIANLFSGQEDYQASNFYLKISFFLNKKFKPNRTLLAENFYFLGKDDSAIKNYKKLKKIGSVYSWHASKVLATIEAQYEDIKKVVKKLEKEFSLITEPDFEDYYEMANFYKNNEYYEKAVEYYSLTLKNINQDHVLVAKILDKRGSSYERIDNWENAEKDLLKSLELSPKQAYVINYLAYSWITKGKNINKSLKMLKEASQLKKDDGYIIDSLGWAYYVNKNYVEAEKYLREAVELMPRDPTINDHYADVLWKLNKNIQARYFWKYVLSLEEVEEELKDSINKKLIFGVTKEL